ncbi:hypothetical protein K438DRAFT_1834330 [Mycena galopus ATCC 62051]|nr:hypothetical protein K438DRAFT_1834330 [Mycena galopus ATCC 62051]
MKLDLLRGRFDVGGSRSRGRSGGSGELRRACGKDVACDGGDVLISDGDLAVLEVERHGVERIRDRLDLARDGREVACAERGFGVRKVGDDPRKDLLALVEEHEVVRVSGTRARLDVVGELYQIVDGRRERGGVARVHRGHVIRGTTVGKSDTRAERGSGSAVHDRGDDKRGLVEEHDEGKSRRRERGLYFVEDKGWLAKTKR